MMPFGTKKNSSYMQGLKSAILAIFHPGPGWPCPVSTQWCVLTNSSPDINRHCSWLDFLKIQVNLVNFLSCTFGRDWEKYSKNGLTFGCLAVFKFEVFFLKNFFFLAETRFWKCYSNICANLGPVLKNLRSGLSKSVEKSTKYWKL